MTNDAPSLQWKHQLLPRNATPWELAEENTDANRYPLDSDAVRRTKDALLVDEKLLPLLAWERSVDVWFAGQSKSAQRYVTDISFELHKRKGTYAGLKRHMELAGAEVISIEAPPLMAFPGRDWTEEERLAWLQRFPQIRTFKYRTHGQIAKAGYLSNDTWFGRDVPVVLIDNPANRCAHYSVDINEFEFHGYHSFLWDRGTETPLTVWTRTVVNDDRTVDVYDWITLPANLNERWFLDHHPLGPSPNQAPLEAGFFCTSDPLAERTISVLRDRTDYQDHNVFFTSRTVQPGLDLIYLKPERVAERWSADRPADMYLDHPNAMPFLTENLAAYHLYDRLYLHDPNRGPVPVPPDLRVFLDHSWYQFPVFTSLSKVGIAITMPAFATGEYMGHGYLVEPDLAPLDRVVSAARAASAARDRTLLDTQTHDVATPSLQVRCGDLICGQQVAV